MWAEHDHGAGWPGNQLNWNKTDVWKSLKIEKYFVHMTMADELKKQGLFVDESFNLRVLERDVQEDTSQLRDENEVFLESEILFE